MKTLKLGSETGSVMNHLYSQNNTEPSVGAFATLLLWTDRTVYKVTEITKTDKEGMATEIKMVRCLSELVSGSFESETQEYDYSETSQKTETFVRKNGVWKQKTTQIQWTDESMKNGNYKRVDDFFKRDKRGDLIWEVIKGVTEQKNTYSKVSILFGQALEYRDPTF